MVEPEKEFVRDKRLCYDLEKIDAKLSQEASRLELFRSCFERTLQFCEDLTSALADTRTQLVHNCEHDELAEEVAREVANFEGKVAASTKSFNQDLIEPLEIFLEHYRESAKEFVLEATRILKEVNEERAKVEKKLKAYNQSTDALDKLQESLLSTEDSAKLEAIKGKYTLTHSENGGGEESGGRKVPDIHPDDHGRERGGEGAGGRVHFGDGGCGAAGGKSPQLLAHAAGQVSARRCQRRVPLRSELRRPLVCAVQNGFEDRL